MGLFAVVLVVVGCLAFELELFGRIASVLHWVLRLDLNKDFITLFLRYLLLYYVLPSKGTFGGVYNIDRFVFQASTWGLFFTNSAL